MIKETSKRISLPKQSAQSCQAASRGEGGLGRGGDQMGRLPLLLAVFLSKKKNLKNDPDLCQQLGKASLPPPPAPSCPLLARRAFVKVIKITPPTIPLRATPSMGLFFLSGRVTVSRTVGRTKLDLGPTHIKAALFQRPPLSPPPSPPPSPVPSPFFFFVFSCFDRKQETITRPRKQAQAASDLRPRSSSCAGAAVVFFRGPRGPADKRNEKEKEKHSRPGTKHGRRAALTHRCAKLMTDELKS